MLLKSLFREMFGSFPKNEKNWSVLKIGEIVTDVRYGSSRPAVENGKYPYIRMNNITYDGRLDLTDLKRIDIPDNEIDKCTVKKGDVLFNRTNSKELVGKTCVYNRDEMMVLAGFVIRVRVDRSKILPEFLSLFLNTDFSKKMLRDKCKSSIGQANINASELQNITIYLPPLILQQKYISLVQLVEKTKATINAMLEKISLLKKAMFREMFGNPILNDKNWPTELLKNVAPVDGYKGEMSDKVWLLNLDMVEANTGSILNYNYVSKEEVGGSVCRFDESNVLYSKLRPYLNKVVIPNQVGYGTSEFLPLKPDPAFLNREFLASLLRSEAFVSYISEKVAGAKMPRVKMTELRNFNVILPPVSLQQQYVSFVAQLEKHEATLERALEDLS